MQGSSKLFDNHPAKQTRDLRIDAVEIRLIRLPLVEPFETSFGKIDSRLIFLDGVKTMSGGVPFFGKAGLSVGIDRMVSHKPQELPQ